MSRDEVHFHIQLARPVAWGITGLMAVLGAAFTLGGLSALFGHSPSEGIVPFVIGLGTLALAWRYALHVLRPHITIGPNALTCRRFWRGTQHWPFAEVTSWQVQVLRMTRDMFGLRLRRPVRIERLLIRDWHGTQRSLILPGFPGANGTLLTLIATRSGLAVERLEMDENHKAPLLAR